MKASFVLLVLCVVAASGAAEDAGLGRLFFTPEQRLLIERQRLYAATPAESSIRLDGRAARQANEPTFWINRHIEHDGRGLAAGLRVGESIDSVTRRRKDLVPDGSIARTPPR